MKKEEIKKNKMNKDDVERDDGECDEVEDDEEGGRGDEDEEYEVVRTVV